MLKPRLIPTLSQPAFNLGSYAHRILALGPIAYWPLNDASGSAAINLVNTALNGTYTGVNLAQAQPPFLAPYFDGANDLCNIYSAAINTAFNRSELSVAMWVKPGFSWTDGISRRSLQFTTTANQDGLSIGKATANNTYALQCFMGGVMKAVTLGSQSWSAWKHVALTASKTADEVKAYMDGAQVGATQTGLATPSANNLAATTCCIGSASTTPANVWSGWLAHLALWDRPLTPVEIANLYAWGA